jgi:hypothetical protein
LSKASFLPAVPLYTTVRDVADGGRRYCITVLYCIGSEKRKEIKKSVNLNLDYAFAVLFIFAYFNVSHLQSIMTLYQQHKFNDAINLNSSKNKRSNANQTDVSESKYTAALQRPELNE